jgi:hypothetical protein
MPSITKKPNPTVSLASSSLLNEIVVPTCDSSRRPVANVELSFIDQATSKSIGVGQLDNGSKCNSATFEVQFASRITVKIGVESCGLLDVGIWMLLVVQWH